MVNNMEVNNKVDKDVDNEATSSVQNEKKQPNEALELIGVLIITFLVAGTRASFVTYLLMPTIWILILGVLWARKMSVLARIISAILGIVVLCLANYFMYYYFY